MLIIVSINKKKMLIIVIYTIYKFLKVCKFLANSMFHFYSHNLNHNQKFNSYIFFEL
jgi:hypothetical protein